MNTPSSNDRPNGRGGLDLFVGVLFLVIGIAFVVMSSSTSKPGMFLLLGVVKIGVGLIKIVRGLGSLGSIDDRRTGE